MAVETLWLVFAVVAVFAAFGLAVGYVNAVAGDKAITYEQEAARKGR
ncbi:hypothetical protein [Pelagibacterium montanilacus]|nr:hypothetical protein [Pelagibacterium montanilacus]